MKHSTAKFRRVMALTLALLLVVGLTGCIGQKDPDPTEEPTGTVTEAPTEKPTEKPTEAATDEPSLPTVDIPSSSGDTPTIPGLSDIPEIPEDLPAVAGCGSAISASAIVVAVVLGAVVLKKKED